MKTLKFKPYFFEPLRSRKKMATIRKSDKGLKKGDLVECWFEGTGFCLLRVVRRVEQVKFKDLKHNHAWFEGYKHVDLLKHELKSIYPDICGDTVLFQIIFERPTLPFESCWDENNPGDVRSFDERLKQKLTPEEYELITSWR